ncbi:ABC transporter permease subunit [Mesorhizobium sp. M0598]|uniref:ABC transporter permease subunit n=1 Tax=Mesorhizobium sp. M0598 TaxID=2956968 RepID=UPI0033383483
MVIGIVVGFAVALGRISGSRLLNGILLAYVEIWRDVPLIVQLLVIYFTLPSIGISLPGRVFSD